MRFSIVTPTHAPKFLPQLWDSIKRQTVQDWEWIILANGGVTHKDVAREIEHDKRIKIYKYDKEVPGIGFLKKNAFSLASGDIIVEADHDDILMSHCLYRLDEAFQEPHIGFAYSNNAKLAEKFTPYNPKFGWEHRTIKYNGMKLTEMIGFPADAGSLAFIWYSPDHVRAWRREVYGRIGGHNFQLEVCDDHELMIRTYLETEFKHIDECLYIYRITGNNTWLERNKKIQEGTKEICREWLPALAERDAQKRDLQMIELGGGLNPRPGYINIDLRDENFTWDLNRGIPLPNDSVGVIWASHILEHLEDKQLIMSEIYRVLRDKGWVFISVPSTDGRGAFQDPTHVAYWNENSFLYYTRKEQADFIGNTSIRFQPYRLDTGYPNDWHKDNDIPVTNAWLRAVKSDSRRPHILEI